MARLLNLLFKTNLRQKHVPHLPVIGGVVKTSVADLDSVRQTSQEKQILNQLFNRQISAVNVRM